jgi:hypothetical protein
MKLEAKFSKPDELASFQADRCSSGRKKQWRMLVAGGIVEKQGKSHD